MLQNGTERVEHIDIALSPFRKSILRRGFNFVLPLFVSKTRSCLRKEPIFPFSSGHRYEAVELFRLDRFRVDVHDFRERVGSSKLARSRQGL